MKIAYLCLQGIGDALMQSPSIKLLKDKYNDSQVDVITMSKTIKFIMENNGICDNVILFEPEKYGLKEILRLIKFGRKERYDISILGFPAYRKEYSIFQFLLGAKKRLSHKFKSGGYIKELHFLSTDYVIFNEDEHNVINNLNLLKKIGIDYKDYYKDISDIKYYLKIPDEYLKYGEEKIKKMNIGNSRIIGIHPGSSNNEAAIIRRWGYKKYAELIKHLVNRNNFVFVFGGKEDIDEINGLKNILKGIDGLFFIEEDFGKTLGILKNVDILICNDNGFGHIGAGLGIKVLSLWGTTYFKWSAPWGKKCKIIRKTKLDPWYRYELKRKIPKGKLSGMSEIEVDDVLFEVENF